MSATSTFYPITVSMQSGNGSYPLALRSYHLEPKEHSRILENLVDLDFVRVGEFKWTCNNTEIRLQHNLGTVAMDDSDPWLSIFDCKNICNRIVSSAFFDTLHKEGIPVYQPYENDVVPWWWREWKRDVFLRVTLAGIRDVFATWKGMVDEKIIALQKRLFSMNGRWPTYPVITSALWMKHFNDIFRFRAAALACLFFSTYLRSPGEPWDWIEKYGPYNKVGRRALYRIPGGITGDLVACAVRLPLSKIPTSRKRWILLSQIGKRAIWNPDYDYERALRIVERSSDAQVVKAYRALAGHFHYQPAGRKLEHVCYAFSHMLDCLEPDSNQATVVRYAELAVDYHRQINEQRIAADAKKYEGTEFPPLPMDKPLPPGFTYLNSVELIAMEAKNLQNCMLNYVSMAAMGACFLFDYKGSVALEVIEGKVVQSVGPNDKITGTSKYARGKLNEWCEGWPVSERAKMWEQIPF